jgi:hypothetical protein
MSLNHLRRFMRALGATFLGIVVLGKVREGNLALRSDGFQNWTLTK